MRSIGRLTAAGALAAICLVTARAQSQRPAAAGDVPFRIERLNAGLDAVISSDAVLETLDHPIPICADESCHTTADLPRLKSRYEVINVKLDKTGGLTEALQLCQRAREDGFKILIGCMVCTSLSIAPARLLASNADFVDLDGPLLLTGDRDHGLLYQNERIGMPVRDVWG